MKIVLALIWWYLADLVYIRDKNNIGGFKWLVFALVYLLGVFVILFVYWLVYGGL